MKYIKISLLFLVLFFSCTTHATLAQTIAAIDSLLTHGKRVAILLIDMQTAHRKTFFLPQNGDIVEEQSVLLAHFSDHPGIIVVDVNITLAPKKLPADLLETIPELKSQIELKKYYKIFYKNTDSSFSQASITTGFESAETTLHGKLGDYLRGQNVANIVPVGCFDAKCVLKTSEGALKEGFAVHVDRDLNIAFREDSKGNPWSGHDKKMEDDLWAALKSEHPKLDMINEHVSSSGSCAP